MSHVSQFGFDGAAAFAIQPNSGPLALTNLVPVLQEIQLFRVYFD